MRIVGGAWKGRTLLAPAGQGTRPTADRVRQALFDMLLHAPWGGRAVIEGAYVLDVFAGTGALGLEALSRGAAHAHFIENDPAALKTLCTNISACGAADRADVEPADALTVGRQPANPKAAGPPATVVFLDPPYRQNLVLRAIDRLSAAGRLAPTALIIAEIGHDEAWTPDSPPLADRRHGAARLLVFQATNRDAD